MTHCHSGVMAPSSAAAMMEHIGDISAISSTTGRNHRRPRSAPDPAGRRSGHRLAGAFGGPASRPNGENNFRRALVLSRSPMTPVRLANVYAIILLPASSMALSTHPLPPP
ncbi:MAG: hypothetical protein ACLU38_15200 [Dysosmobacter sp.]